MDCAIVNAGNIRGNTLYPLDKSGFTYADLKQEVPFPCEVQAAAPIGRHQLRLLDSPHGCLWAV